MANPYYGGYPGMPNWNQPVMYPMNQQIYNQPMQQAIPQQEQQQMMQQPQRPTRSYIPGRFVSPDEKIMANEVSADGSISLFPVTDHESILPPKILLKKINETGLIETVTYARVQDKDNDTNASGVDDILPSILERLERIEKMVKKNNYYYRKNNEKKEGD